MEQEEEKNTRIPLISQKSNDIRVNFLNKNKYAFFNILSYAYLRAEARLLLN
jgi:hypothetical protein